jgi:hypothetical protein
MPVPHRESRRVELALGTLLVGTFMAFAFVALPRLTNNAFGDHEFSGWSGAVGNEIAEGRVPYVDFVLPIPPGSLLVLGWIQKLGGKLLVINELRLIAVCQLLMSGLAYWLARPFTTRQNAWLVAFASMVTLLRGPKECAYDHTAEVVAWGSILLGTLAMVWLNERRRLLAWVACGTLGTFTLAFKQSTGTGVILGWLVAFAYLGLRQRAVFRRGFFPWSLGCALGLGVLWLLLLTCGSSLGAYVQAVFRDGSSLKGGSFALAGNLGGYLLGESSFPSSLVVTLLLAAVLVRVLTREGPLSLPAQADSGLTSRAGVTIFVPVLVVFGIAMILFWTRVHGLSDGVLHWLKNLNFVADLGLVFAAVYFVSELRSRTPSDEPLPERGQALNALVLVALVTSLLHNLSAREFRPFYDPNPLIPIAFLFLFGALDRAELPRAKIAAFALALVALFSPKLDRALSAQIDMGREGYFAGMLANENALPLVRASERVRELTSDADTVLVLPEDLELRSLIGRPRPAIRGAVLFVDQYAARLADADLATLERDLPKVVVVRPNDRKLWVLFFALWTTRSGAQRVAERFLDDWLPSRYVRDSTFPTRFDSKLATLEIWVRRDSNR